MQVEAPALINEIRGQHWDPEQKKWVSDPHAMNEYWAVERGCERRGGRLLLVGLLTLRQCPSRLLLLLLLLHRPLLLSLRPTLSEEHLTNGRRKRKLQDLIQVDFDRTDHSEFKIDQ